MNITNYPLSRGANQQTPNRAIIHAMAEYVFYKGKFRHATEFLEMVEYEYKGEPRRGLSAHILIEPNGDIIKCREANQGALHAAGHNVDTLGAEWLVKGEHYYEGFLEAIQHPYLADLQFNNGCAYIGEQWVKGSGVLNYEEHSKVDPDRKVDPGDGFPWTEFLKKIGVIWRS